VEAKKIDRRQQRPRASKRYPDSPQIHRRKPKRRPRRLLWLWASLLGVGLISASGGAMLALTLGNRPLLGAKLSAEDWAFFNRNPNPFSRNTLQVPALNEPVNILLMGVKTNLSDLRTDGAREERQKLGYDAETNSFEGLSDTILLLRFDPDTRKISILGIPRDTRITAATGNYVKINAVNADSGPAASAKAVSDLLGGVPIDRYIRVNIQGVEKLIDAIGGVTVDVPADLKYQDDSQHLYINLKKGRQHLNGAKALGVLRFRHDALGDLGRIQRQQLVIKALMEQALNPFNVARTPQILAVVKDHIDTNLTGEELLALASFGMSNKSKPQMLVLPGDFNGDGRHGTSYWIAEPKATQNLVARYFSHGEVDPSTIDPKRARIVIQDSTNSPAYVQQLVAKLQREGYSNVHIDKPLQPPLRETQVIAQKGEPILAEMLVKTLGFGDSRVEVSGNFYSDVTIKLGIDWAQR
jgi:LCP family protein required for cell wall assembly